MMGTTFINGMDISFLDEIEQGGGEFRSGLSAESDESIDLLHILKNSGVNSIRLRIWNNPPGGYCNLERTLIMAKRIKAAGLGFLLDFHYSDSIIGNQHGFPLKRNGRWAMTTTGVI